MQTLQVYPHFFCNIFKMADLEKADVCVLRFFSIALIYFVLYSRASMGAGTHDCLYSAIIWTKLAVAK